MYKHLELDTEDIKNVIADYCHCNDVSNVNLIIKNSSEVMVIVDYTKKLEATK